MSAQYFIRKLITRAIRPRTAAPVRRVPGTRLGLHGTGLEERVTPAALYATNTANQLLSFDSATPGAVTIIGTVTGLQAGEAVLGLDGRPADGRLYALGVTDDGTTRTGRIYTVDPATAVATQVGGAPFSTTLGDTNFWGTDFNPTVDLIRITNRLGENYRVSPATGALVSTDTPLTQTGINGIAYTNGGPGAVTLYGYNFFTDAIVTIGGINGVPSPNEGQVFTVGPSGFVAQDRVHFDILNSGAGTAYITANNGGGVPQLYTVNLATGAATVVGAIGGTLSSLTGFAAAISPLTGAVVVNGTGANDSLVVTATGVNSGSYSLNGGPAVAFGPVTAFRFVGLDGNDLFRVINPAGGLFAPADGVLFEGGSQTGAPGDQLEILGGVASSVAFGYSPPGATGNNGSVTLVNGADTANYTYTGLEPVVVDLSAAPAVVTINLPDDGVNNNALIADNGNLGDGLSQVSGTGIETTTFNNPTFNLQVNYSDDGEVVTLRRLDDGFGAFITNAGNTGNDGFILDYSTAAGVNVIPRNDPLAISFVAGGGSNFLRLLGSSGYTPTDVTYDFSNNNPATRPTVLVDGRGLSFTGVGNDIIDQLVPANRTFGYTAAAETITLSDDGGGANGFSQIVSNTAPGVIFADPTAVLTLNAGDGVDAITFRALDPLAASPAVMIVNGEGGNDSLTVDFAFGDPTPPAGNTGSLTFNGGNAPAGDVDTLALSSVSANTVAITLLPDDATGHNGMINLDGVQINYTGLEPVSITGTMTNLIINLPDDGQSNSTVLGDDGGAADPDGVNDPGVSAVRSGNNTFEYTEFSNPTTSLTINSSDDGEDVTAGPLDPLNPPPVINLNGDTGNDSFNVTPSAQSTFNVDGNAPTAAGDTLTFDAQGQPVTGDSTPPDGTLNTPGEMPVNFTEIETVNVLNPAAPTFTIDDVTVTEGGGAVFTVTLSSLSGQDVTITYNTSAGTATPGADYTEQTAPPALVIPAGSLTGAITVPTLGDNIFEPDETFFLNLLTATNAVIADPQGQATITNDDPIPTVSIGDATAGEGDAGTTPFVFTVTLTNPSSQTITVSYTTNDGTATVADLDYVGNAGTLTFAPGVTTQTITVLVNGDAKFEANETFTVTLTSGVGVLPGDTTGLGTITDDDPTPTVSVGDTTAAEGAQAVFTLTLSNTSDQTVTVRVNTTGGTATANVDYNNIDSFFDVVFLPGETSRTVPVPTFQDNIDEPDETFVMNILSATNATAADPQGQGTITDDDPTPAVSIDDVTVTEGNAGTVAATFTITLSGPSGQTVTVDFTTTDGTATVADNDYVFTSGTVTFAPGQTTQTVPVPVNGDARTEPNETFTVTLTGVGPAGGAALGDSTGAGTILNDDPPAASVGDTTVAEGGSAVFTITLSVPSTLDVTLTYNTTSETATGDVDYNQQNAPATIVILAGQTTATVSIPTFPDNIDEPDETFFLNLLTATNATVADAQGQGTILDDDTPTADLGVTTTDAPDPVTAGQTLTYTLTVTTAGPDAATDVVLTDVLPANTTFVSLTTPAGWTATMPAAGAPGTVTATRATLPAGSLPQVFTLVVNVNPGAPVNVPVSNTATVGAATFDPDGSNNSDTESTTPVTTADLRVTATDSPDPVRANGLLTYTITVANVGPSDAALVTLTDHVPANTTFVSFTQTTGPAFTVTTPPAGGTGFVSATAPTLAATATATFTLVVRVNPGTPIGTVIVNTPGASSLTFDPTQPNTPVIETRVAGAVLPIVVGAGAGSARVRVFDPTTLAETRTFVAYPGFDGRVRVAAGDVTGDGVVDIITGAGAGGAAHVKVFDGATGAEIRSFFAYAPGFLGGVFVAAGDVDGDGFADVVTGAGAGAGSHVKVFSGRTGAELQSFFAFAPGFLGGVTVAAADLDGDGRDEVVTGASDGGSAHVKVFDQTIRERASFFAFDSVIRGGVFVAAGDLDGDGRAEVIAGNGQAAAEVKTFVFGGGGVAQGAVLTLDPETVRSGVRVAVADRGADGQLDVVTGAGPGSPPLVQIFNGRTLEQLDRFEAFEAGVTGGVFVG